jgi:hypothetical protein
MLIYEPATAKGRPLPLARIHDAELMVRAANCAIAQAEARAAELELADEFLGEAEREEVRRLRAVLALLIPGIATGDTQTTAVQ